MGLNEFVTARNGVPLGHKDSLANNLRRSFGAASPRLFWRHWNPVWGFYLSRFVYVPVSAWLPRPMALLITFLVSGAVHDLAVAALGLGVQWTLTTTFGLLGLVVIATDYGAVHYESWGFWPRAAIHSAMLGVCAACALLCLTH